MLKQSALELIHHGAPKVILQIGCGPTEEQYHKLNKHKKDEKKKKGDKEDLVTVGQIRLNRARLVKYIITQDKEH